jgi:adenylate kinase
LKAAHARLTLSPPTSEDLRLGAVHDNQKLLVSEFRSATRGNEGLTILDAHLLIDGRDGLIEIPTTVFRELEITKIIFLQAPASEIASRRSNDDFRVRPARSIEELRQHQSYELSLSSALCLELGIPLIVVCSNNVDLVAKFLLP